jgi:hypothetical protein
MGSSRGSGSASIRSARELAMAWSPSGRSRCGRGCAQTRAMARVGSTRTRRGVASTRSPRGSRRAADRCGPRSGGSRAPGPRSRMALARAGGPASQAVEYPVETPRCSPTRGGGRGATTNERTPGRTPSPRPRPVATRARDRTPAGWRGSGPICRRGARPRASIGSACCLAVVRRGSRRPGTAPRWSRRRTRQQGARIDRRSPEPGLETPG